MKLSTSIIASAALLLSSVVNAQVRVFQIGPDKSFKSDKGQPLCLGQGEDRLKTLEFAAICELNFIYAFNFKFDKDNNRDTFIPRLYRQSRNGNRYFSFLTVNRESYGTDALYFRWEYTPENPLTVPVLTVPKSSKGDCPVDFLAIERKTKRIYFQSTCPGDNGVILSGYMAMLDIPNFAVTEPVKPRKIPGLWATTRYPVYAYPVPDNKRPL